MENATKALLIAAAVLVAILIISLGLVVYNMASETIDSVNFSGQEVTAFNDQFTHYNGNRVRGSEVNAMIKTVLSSNMKSRSEGLTPNSDGSSTPKFVKITTTDATNQIKLENTATSSGTVSANTSKTYKVEVCYNATTGFVDEIKVNVNAS